MYTYTNPLWYRGYRIYQNDIGFGPAFCFVHDDFDGAPDSGDKRCGYESTIDFCKAEIDVIEDE